MFCLIVSLIHCNLTISHIFHTTETGICQLGLSLSNWNIFMVECHRTIFQQIWFDHFSLNGYPTIFFMQHQNENAFFSLSFFAQQCHLCGGKLLQYLADACIGCAMCGYRGTVAKIVLTSGINLCSNQKRNNDHNVKCIRNACIEEETERTTQLCFIL